MKANIEIQTVAEARELMMGADGFVMIGLDTCDPCRFVWDALQKPRFARFGKRKIMLSGANAEHRAYVRELKLQGFPSILLFERGVEQRRVAGAVQTENLDAIGGWLEWAFDLDGGAEGIEAVARAIGATV